VSDDRGREGARGYLDGKKLLMFLIPVLERLQDVRAVDDHAEASVRLRPLADAAALLVVRGEAVALLSGLHVPAEAGGDGGGEAVGCGGVRTFDPDDSQHDGFVVVVVVVAFLAGRGLFFLGLST
jgi:hypothetical protein